MTDFRAVVYSLTMTEKKQTKGIKTRERVIKCASELMSEKGVGAASLSDIAGAAGIRKPSLYNHFESRDELEESVFSYIETLLEKADFLPPDIASIAENYTAAAVLKAVIFRYVKAFIVPPALNAYKIIASEKFFNGRVAQIAEQQHERLLAQVKELVSIMTGAGKLAASDDDFAAEMLTHEIEGIISESVIAGAADEENVAAFSERFALLYAVR